MIPFFSIIIPTFNRANHLEKALKSISEQNFSSWECLIIDDGSTDNTANIVNNRIQKDKRFQYYFQQNAERSAARNNGLNKAKGNYICFLDSDDQYDINFLAHLYLHILSNNFPDLIISELRVMNKKNQVLKIKTNPIKKYVNPETYFFAESIVPGRCCIRKDIFQTIQFNEKIKISEDTMLLCEIGANYKNITFCTDAFLFYNQHDDNSVNYKKYNAYKDRIATLKQIIKSHYGLHIDKAIARQTINDCYFGIYKYHYFRGEKLKAILSIFRSLIAYPQHRFKEKLYLILKSNKKHLFD